MELPERNLTLVFDVAGVLLEWDPMRVYDEVFQKSGRDQAEFFSRVLDSETMNAISAGQSMSSVLADRIGSFPGWESEIRIFEERWNEMLVGLISGTDDVIGELQERGYRVFLLGNWGREEFNWARERFPILSTMNGVLLSGDCGILKPDTRIFALAEEQFGLEPASTIFIDDRADNVQAALDRGWNGIVFENSRHLYLTLMEYGIL